MACLWNALLLFRRGLTGRRAIEVVARCSEWWPSWDVDQVCRVACESVTLPSPPSTQKSITPTALPPTPEAQVAPSPEGLKRLGNRKVEKARVHDATKPLGDLDVRLDAAHKIFTIELPIWLPVSAGPVSLSTPDTRVAGHADDSGSVAWHTADRLLAFPLRGENERPVQVEGCGLSVSQTVRLWDRSEYLTLYNCASAAACPLDPFMVPLPRNGPLALLTHESLDVSIVADETLRLDDEFVLRIYRSGIPDGTTVSLSDEVLWRGEVQEPGRQFLDVGAVTLAVGASSAKWGGFSDLVVTGAPEGFEPIKAMVGSQSLKAISEGGRWRFPDYLLIPGLDSVRRRGRVDGLLGGDRVIVPAEVVLGHVPIGAALRLPCGWKPLDADGAFDQAMDGAGRLWVSLPNKGQDVEWTVFEGPRPVAAYRGAGVQLGRKLMGLGERLLVGSGRFNLTSQATMLLANHVSDTGAVAGLSLGDATASMALRTPIQWTSQHRAFAWGAEGMLELDAPDDISPGTTFGFRVPDLDIAGVSLFHEKTWLGSAGITAARSGSAATFLRSASNWPECLLFAIDARLPVLSDDALRAVSSRLGSDGGKGAVALCRGSLTRERRYAAGRILASWDPTPRVSEMLVNDFRQKGAAGSPTILATLLALAPACAMKAIARGIQHIGKHDRPRLLMLLGMTALPEAVRGTLGATPPERFLEAAESALLARAMEKTRLDENFLASRVGASIGSLAWGVVTSSSEDTSHFNLATAMTIAPIREWLCVHLLRRLAGLVAA